MLAVPTVIVISGGFSMIGLAVHIRRLIKHSSIDKVGSRVCCQVKLGMPLLIIKTSEPSLGMTLPVLMVKKNQLILLHPTQSTVQAYLVRDGGVGEIGQQLDLIK